MALRTGGGDVSNIRKAAIATGVVLLLAAAVLTLQPVDAHSALGPSVGCGTIASPATPTYGGGPLERLAGRADTTSCGNARSSRTQIVVIAAIVGALTLAGGILRFGRDPRRPMRSRHPSSRRSGGSTRRATASAPHLGDVAAPETHVL